MTRDGSSTHRTRVSKIGLNAEAKVYYKKYLELLGENTSKASPIDFEMPSYLILRTALLSFSDRSEYAEFKRNPIIPVS